MAHYPTPPPSPTSLAKGAPSTPEARVGQILPCGIQLVSVLGVGAYGVVYVARDRHGNHYAVKALNKVGLSRRQRKFLQREIELHRKANSPHVVTLIDVIDTVDCLYVVLEYCPEGDLFGNITERGRYVGNDPLVKSIFLQLLDAVEHCHSVGIYHRDLKPENILIKDSGLTAKLADFGLASTDSCSSDFGCGSTFYMSPECLQDSPKAFSCYASAPNDVWSLGVILCNLASGRNPWKKASVDDPTFAAFLRDSEFLKSILPITDELDWILRCIFECDPSQRVTIPQLRQMILRCQSFTATSTSSTCLDAVSAPPAHDAAVSLATGSNNSDQSVAESQFSGFSAESGSSNSSFEWDLSAPSSPYAISPSTTSSWQADCSIVDFESSPPSPPTIIEHIQPKADQVSAPQNTWFAPFIPALDLAQKHMSLTPFFPVVRAF